ncbi:hypothetical protein ACVJBD_007463 [Rhizobium mongolense]
MTAVLQQLSLALGVAVAGAILEIERALSGGPLELADFHTAFMIIAICNLLAAIPSSRWQRMSALPRPAIRN